MGRPQEKETAENSRRISIWWLKKHNFLNGFSTGAISWSWGGDNGDKSSISIDCDTEQGYVRLHYTQKDYWNEEKKYLDYKHGLVSTHCRFGGKRYWFKCQLSKNGRFCGRRVGVLYKSPGSYYWGCRYCHNITYESTRINHSNIFCQLLEWELRVEKLVEKIKRRFWRGKPTKKYRKLQKLLRE